MMLRPIFRLTVVALVLSCLAGCGQNSAIREQFEATEAALSSKADVTSNVKLLESPTTPRSDERSQPWQVGQGVGSSATTIWLGSNIPKGASVRSAVVSEVARRALIVYRPRKDRGKPQPLDVALWVNLNSKTIESKWKLPIPLGAFSIHPTGKRAVLRGEPFNGPGLETLYLIRFPDGGTPLMKKWIPLWKSNVDGKVWSEGSSHLTWVGFVGDESIATVNFDGVLHLWRLRDLEHFATFTDTIGLPDVTPDGQKIAIATEKGVALIDPKRRRVVGFHPIASMPKKPTLAFNPNGKTLGVIGDTSTIVVDLVARTDVTLHTTYVENGHYGKRPSVGWVGDYLCTGSKLTDVSAGVAVWQIQGPKWTFPARDAIWAILPENSGTKRFALQCFPVSSRAIAKKVDSILRKSEALPWRVGKKVRVDVAPLPAQYRTEARAGLAKRLQENGFLVADNSSLVLRASLGKLSKKENNVTYNMNGDGQKWDEEISYRHRPAVLEIVDDGQIIWSRKKTHHAPMFVLGSEESIETQFDRLGEPDYSLFSDRLPEYVQRGQRDALLKTRLYAK